MSIYISFNGKTGDAALIELKRKFSNMAVDIIHELPESYFQTIKRNVYKYFKDNYINMVGWERPFYTSSAYEMRKEKWMTEGTTFQIGRLGTFPIAHSFDVFGRLTDTVFNALGGGKGSVYNRVSMMSSESSIKSSVKMEYGVDSDQWEGGRKEVGKEQRTNKNSLLMFLERIGDNDVLVRLTQGQRTNIEDITTKAVSQAFEEVFNSTGVLNTAV